MGVARFIHLGTIEEVIDVLAPLIPRASRRVLRWPENGDLDLRIREGIRPHVEIVACDGSRCITERASLNLTVTPLSASERRVLHYLQTHRSFPEIADVLGLSRHTVKTHATTLYRKLEVTSRSAAVDRARALGLLSSEDSRWGRGSDGATGQTVVERLVTTRVARSSLD